MDVATTPAAVSPATSLSTLVDTPSIATSTERLVLETPDRRMPAQCSDGLGHSALAAEDFASQFHGRGCHDSWAGLLSQSDHKMSVAMIELSDEWVALVSPCRGSFVKVIGAFRQLMDTLA